MNKHILLTVVIISLTFIRTGHGSSGSSEEGSGDQNYIRGHGYHRSREEGSGDLNHGKGHGDHGSHEEGSGDLNHIKGHGDHGSHEEGSGDLNHIKGHGDHGSREKGSGDLNHIRGHGDHRSSDLYNIKDSKPLHYMPKTISSNNSDTSTKSTEIMLNKILKKINTLNNLYEDVIQIKHIVMHNKEELININNNIINTQYIDKIFSMIGLHTLPTSNKQQETIEGDVKLITKLYLDHLAGKKKILHNGNRTLEGCDIQSKAGYCYVIRQERMSWWAARAECYMMGGQLTSLRFIYNVSTLIKKVRRNSMDLSTYMWLGASDLSVKDNIWSWVTGEPLSNYSSLWGEDDPDEGDDDHCAGIGTFKIYDRNCNEENSFICEIPKHL